MLLPSELTAAGVAGVGALLIQNTTEDLIVRAAALKGLRTTLLNETVSAIPPGKKVHQGRSSTRPSREHVQGVQGSISIPYENVGANYKLGYYDCLVPFFQSMSQNYINVCFSEILMAPSRSSSSLPWHRGHWE